MKKRTNISHVDSIWRFFQYNTKSQKRIYEAAYLWRFILDLDGWKFLVKGTHRLSNAAAALQGQKDKETYSCKSKNFRSILIKF
jgi:hypothetical protein